MWCGCGEYLFSQLSLLFSISIIKVFGTFLLLFLGFLAFLRSSVSNSGYIINMVDKLKAPVWCVRVLLEFLL